MMQCLTRETQKSWSSCGQFQFSDTTCARPFLVKLHGCFVWSHHFGHHIFSLKDRNCKVLHVMCCACLLYRTACTWVIANVVWAPALFFRFFGIVGFHPPLCPCSCHILPSVSLSLSTDRNDRPWKGERVCGLSFPFSLTWSGHHLLSSLFLLGALFLVSVRHDINASHTV